MHLFDVAVSEFSRQIKYLPESVMIFGCGYVGSALGDYLLRHGVRVGALTRNPEKAGRLRAAGLSEVIEADLDSSDWHRQLVGDYRSIVNCVSSAGGGIAGYRKSYLDGQRSILQWAKERSIETFVYTSSTSVYPQDGGVAVDETSLTANLSETGQILLESENLVAGCADAFRRWYVFRLAGIYGPRRHYLLDFLRLGERVIPGSGDHHLNLIYRDDIVSAIFRALSTDHEASSGLYNLADDSAVTKAYLVNRLADRLGIERPAFDPDATTPRLKRRGGQMPDRIVLNSKAKEAFGWRPKYPAFEEAYDFIIKQTADSEL